MSDTIAISGWFLSFISLLSWIPIVDYLNTILNDDIIIDRALEQDFVSRKHQIDNIVNDRRAAKTTQMVHVVDVLDMLIDHDFRVHRLC